MDEREILKLAKTVKPVLNMKLEIDGRYVDTLSYIEPVDLWKSYLKDPVFACKAPNFKLLAQIITRHQSVYSNGYVLRFYPSAEEVLADMATKLSKDVLDKAVAFETKFVGNTFNNNWQLSRTNIYGLEDGAKVPEKVKEQKVVYNGAEYSPKDL